MPSPSPRAWRFEAPSSSSSSSSSLSSSSSSSHTLAAPLGFRANVAVAASGAADDARRRAEVAALRRRVWATAKQPASSIPMTAFTMWMFVSGSPHIFTLMFLGMSLYQGLTGLFAVASVFSPLEERARQLNNCMSSSEFIVPKLMFFVLSLAVAAIPVYKCHTMNLLPGPADAALGVRYADVHEFFAR